MSGKNSSQGDAANSADDVVDDAAGAAAESQDAEAQAAEVIESGIDDGDLIDSLGVARAETDREESAQTVAGDARSDAAAETDAAAGAGSGAGAGAGAKPGETKPAEQKPDPIEQKLAKLEETLGKLIEKSAAGETLTAKEQQQVQQAARNIDKLREARKGGNFDILEEANAQLLLDSLDEQARENADLRERLSRLETDTQPVRDDAVWSRAAREHGLPAEKLQKMFDDEVKRVQEEEGYQGSELRAAATFSWKQRIKAEKAAATKPAPAPAATPAQQQQQQRQAQQQPRGSTTISPRTPRRPAPPAVDEEAQFLKEFGKDLVDTHTERG